MEGRSTTHFTEDDLQRIIQEKTIIALIYCPDAVTLQHHASSPKEKGL